MHVLSQSGIDLSPFRPLGGLAPAWTVSCETLADDKRLSQQMGKKEETKFDCQPRLTPVSSTSRYGLSGWHLGESPDECALARGMKPPTKISGRITILSPTASASFFAWVPALKGIAKDCQLQLVIATVHVLRRLSTMGLLKYPFISETHQFG